MSDNAKTRGIVGGGQLGRMLASSAQKLGFKTIVLDPTPHSPAGQVADEQLLGSFKDPEAIRELAKKCDVMTFEIESADAGALHTLEEEGKPVYPSSKTLSIIKDKYSQKIFLRECGIPVADFLDVATKDDTFLVIQEFSYPFLLKAKFDAYDGRGNALIREEADIDPAFEKLSKSPLYAERFVPFIKELAVIVARSTTDEIKTYPVVETVHKNNICHIVSAPAVVSEDIQQRARDVAYKAIDALEGIGVFAVELFLLESGEVVLNEIAPRVHNSGHYSIEGSKTSQFENHIRAITGMPLGDTDMAHPVAVMVNILGEREGTAEPQGHEVYENSDDVFVHFYGKTDTRQERKMGHITVVGTDLESTRKKAEEVRKNISI